MQTEFHLDKPIDSEENMRFDESFFHQLNQSNSNPLIDLEEYSKHHYDKTIIRIYEWSRPTISLGIAQSNDIFNSTLLKDDIKTVKRITGGRVVLHYQEITYAVIGTIGGFWGDTLHETYTKIADILKQFLTNLGIKVDEVSQENKPETPTPKIHNRSLSCYDALGFKEISVAGKKLIGSAQKRGQYGFLQHGSIPYYRHELRLENYLVPEYLPKKPMEDAYVFINDFINTPIDVAKEILETTFKNALGAYSTYEVGKEKISLNPKPKNTTNCKNINMVNHMLSR